MAPVSTSFSAYLAPAAFSIDGVYASAAFAMTDDAKPSPMPSLVHHMPKFDGGEESRVGEAFRPPTIALPAPSATFNHSDTVTPSNGTRIYQLSGYALQR